MDLGSLVCTRKPACERCPLDAICQAHAQGNPTAYPTPKPKKSLKVKRVQMLIAHNGADEVLLEQRPPSGIWGGLWGFPEAPDASALPEWIARQFAGEAALLEIWPQRRHTFSHFHLEITPVEVLVNNHASCVMDEPRRVWYNTATPDARGLAAPVARIIDELKQRSTGEAK